MEIRKIFGGVMELQPKILGDDRGYFYTVINKDILAKLNNFEFVQENTSFSKEKHTLRGIHLQIGKYAQAKIVRCVKGRILDIFVDLDPESSNFGKYSSIILDSEKKNQVYVPRGYGHAFITLEENCIVSYIVDNAYNEQSYLSIKWNDKDLKINWPSKQVTMSERDEKGISLKEYKKILNSK